MSFEEIMQAHTAALNNHAAALRGEGVPAFVTNAKAAEAAEGKAPKAAKAPKAPKAAEVESVDPLQHPAFLKIVDGVRKLVDLDNKNKTTRTADLCAAFGVQKASLLESSQWPNFQAHLDTALAEASAPAPAAASSFV